MPDIDRPPGKTSHLRKQAEKILRVKIAQSPLVNVSLSSAETQRVLHELEVYQFELEMQNEELRLAQAALAAEKERYFHLFELAPVGYCTISEKGLIDKINLTAASLLGISRSALLKSFLSRFIVKEDQDIYYLHQKQLLETAEPQAYELRMLKQDGTLWWAHMEAVFTQNEDGSPAPRITFSNITQRKLAETQEKLRVKETQAFNGLRELAGRTDIDLDDLLQKFVGLLPASWQYPEITYARLVIGDREFHTENYRESPWKQSAPVKIQGSPAGKLEVGYLEEMPDQGDGPFFKETRVLLTRLAERLGLVIDRQRSDLMLRKSEEKYRTLVEMTNTGFLILDKEGKVSDANQEYIRLTGHRELGEILGKSVNEWTADYDKQNNVMAVNQCIKVGFIRDFVIDYVDGNGRITTIQINATVNGSGESLHIVSLCRNVTKRKQAEEKLERLYQEEKRLRQELQDEAKARGMFIDILAHELRTPLTPVTVCSAMLQEMVSSHDLGIEKKLVANMYSGTQALTRRIEELLDLGKFSRGTFTLLKQMVNVTDLVSKTAARFKPLAEQQSRQLVLEIQDNLPDIEVDPARLEQVLDNLLSNAVKYSPQKSIITLKAGKTDSNIVIEVHDEGKCITSEEQKKFFDPYHRVMQDTQKLPGIGLGLAICKQIMEAHGGKISIENQINQGNCFKVELLIHNGIEDKNETASG